VVGAISEVLIDDNQFLRKGDPIAGLDPRDYDMALKVAPTYQNNLFCSPFSGI